MPRIELDVTNYAVVDPEYAEYSMYADVYSVPRDIVDAWVDGLDVCYGVSHTGRDGFQKLTFYGNRSALCVLLERYEDDEDLRRGLINDIQG